MVIKRKYSKTGPALAALAVSFGIFTSTASAAPKKTKQASTTVMSASITASAPAPGSVASAATTIAGVATPVVKKATTPNRSKLATVPKDTNNNNTGEIPLLAPIKINSPLTLTQAFPNVFVTGPMNTSYPSIVTPDADMAFEDARVRRDIMAMKGRFSYLANAPVEALIDGDVHYELGDPRISKLTLDQLSAKASSGKPLYERVIRVTDFNTIFKAPPKTTSEFNALIAQGDQVYLDNDKAREFKSVLAAAGNEVEIFSSEPGHTYSELSTKSTKRLWIASQPLWDASSGVAPILHNKEWFNAYRDSKSGKLVPIYGSIAEINYSLPDDVKFGPDGKATPQGRLNTGYHIADPLIIQNIMDHTTAMLEALGDGKQINEIVSVQPVEAHYADGALVRLYYTDGKYNPNSIRVNLLRDAIVTYKLAHNLPLAPTEEAPPRKIEVISSTKFLYVDTYKPDLLAEIDLQNLLGDSWSRLYFLDDQFYGPEGFGVGPAYVGSVIDRPSGGQIRDFTGALAKDKNARVYVMQRAIEGERTKPFLLHGKDVTDLVKVDGVLYYFKHDGSYNWSNHSANSESRMYFEIPANSDWGKATAEITPATIANLAPLGLAVEGLVADVRNILAELTKHNNLEIPLANVEEIIDLLNKIAAAKTPAAITDGISQVIVKMRAVYAIKTAASRPEKAADFEAKMQAIAKFAINYSKLPIDPVNGAGLTTQKFFAGIEHIVDSGASAINTKADFDFLIGGKVSAADLDAAKQQFWKDEGITAPYPIDGVKPVPTAKVGAPDSPKAAAKKSAATPAANCKADLSAGIPPRTKKAI